MATITDDDSDGDGARDAGTRYVSFFFTLPFHQLTNVLILLYRTLISVAYHHLPHPTTRLRRIELPCTSGPSSRIDYMTTTTRSRDAGASRAPGLFFFTYFN